MTVSGGSSISVPMIESRRSVYVVCPGAFTPPTESLKRVSPVNTTATPPSKPPGTELAPARDRGGGARTGADGRGLSPGRLWGRGGRGVHGRPPFQGLRWRWGAPGGHHV